MQIERIKLIEILVAVRPGLARKEITDQSTHFLFYKKNIFTYNDRIAISHPISELDFIGSVNSDKFYNLLNKLDKENVKILKKEKELRILSGKSHAGITMEEEIPKNLLDVFNYIFKAEKKWKHLPKDFIQGVSFCLSAYSKDISRPILTVLHWKNNIIEACDNFRIAQYRMEEKGKEDLLIPANSLEQIKEYNPIQYSITKEWIHFKNKKGILYSIRMLGEATNKYPDLSKVVMEQGIKIKVPKKIKSVLERTTLFSTEQVSINISTDEWKMQSKDQQGWFKETIPCKYKGKIIQFNISPKTLLEMPEGELKASLSKNILKFEDKKRIYCCSIQANKKEQK